MNLAYIFTSIVSIAGLVGVLPSFGEAILRFIGFNKATVTAEGAIKGLSDAIESAVINSNPHGFNSRLVHSQERGRTYGYVLDDNTLVRWYCRRHGLKTLSSYACWEERERDKKQGGVSWPCWKEGNGIIIFRYTRERLSQYQMGADDYATWQLICSTSTRQAFLERMTPEAKSVEWVVCHRPNRLPRRTYAPWQAAELIAVRAKERVVLDEALLNDIFERITSYMARRKKALERGIPCQLGILLSGPPGVGKTTLVDLLGRVYKLKIYKYVLGDTDLQDSDLVAMSKSMCPNSIALFDDIERTGPSNGTFTIQGLMKAFDLAPDRILILTTNNRAKIDPVLLRSGRIDVEYKFKFASKSQLKGLFIYTNTWTDEETETHNMEALAEQFSNLVPDYKHSPADITSYLQRVSGPLDAIKNVNKIEATSESEIEVVGHDKLTVGGSTRMESGVLMKMAGRKWFEPRYAGIRLRARKLLSRRA